MAGFAAKTMIYRGLGSGIVRAMREDNHIDFDNEVSANQFKVTIWRTTHNNKSSTQKKPLKDSNTIQKESNTIQKSDTTTQKKPLKDSRTSQKDSGTIQKNLDSLEEVLKFLIENPKATIGKMVDAISNLSLGGVKFVIGKLQKKGLLKRVGRRKHGEWQVLIQYVIPKSDNYSCLPY